MGSIQFKLSGDWKRHQRVTSNLGKNLHNAAQAMFDAEEQYLRNAINTVITKMNGNNGPYARAKVRMTHIMVSQQGGTITIGVFVSWDELRETFRKGSPFWHEIDTPTRRGIFRAFKKYGITKSGGDLSQLTMFSPVPDLEPIEDEMVVGRSQQRLETTWKRSSSSVWR